MGCQLHSMEVHVKGCQACSDVSIECNTGDGILKPGVRSMGVQTKKCCHVATFEGMTD